MMFYISMKFHENAQTVFLFIELTCNNYCQICKGNNSRNIHTRVMVLVPACCLIILYILMKFLENIFYGFQDSQHDFVTDQ